MPESARKSSAAERRGMQWSRSGANMTIRVRLWAAAFGTVIVVSSLAYDQISNPRQWLQRIDGRSLVT